MTVEPFATAAVPAELGLCRRAACAARSSPDGCVDVGMLPGVVSLVSRHGRIAHLDSYGSMDLEAGRPMQPGTIFRMYSMTKPVVSVALMMLYEEGRFRLEEPVETFIPALAERQVLIGGTAARPELVPARRSITLRDLLTHTSGIIYPGWGRCRRARRDLPVDPGRWALRQPGSAGVCRGAWQGAARVPSRRVLELWPVDRRLRAPGRGDLGKDARRLSVGAHLRAA